MLKVLLQIKIKSRTSEDFFVVGITVAAGTKRWPNVSLSLSRNKLGNRQTPRIQRFGTDAEHAGLACSCGSLQWEGLIYPVSGISVAAHDNCT